jgi:predicted branched-subunit amino acid permease
VRDSVALGLAVGTYGLSFGAVASAAGLSVPQACAASLLMFTGASQFALVGVLGAGGSAVAGVLGALLLGSRNTLYAVRLAELLRLRGAQRIVAAHVTIDESMAMATGAPKALERTAFWTTGLTIYVVWNLMTLLGAAGAARLGDPARLGLDAVAPAAFLALLAPRLRDRQSLRIAVGGAALALLAVPLLPTGVPVLVAGAAVLPVLVRR